MIVNRNALLAAAPIKNMVAEKRREHGVSYGLSEAGYDIRIKQDITFSGMRALRLDIDDPSLSTPHVFVDGERREGFFTLASAIEEFQIPPDMVGEIKDKSTWIRQGLYIGNTVAEPGWKGFLTLELAYFGYEPLHIPAGAGIAQVLFFRTQELASYEGKYQDQEDRPVESKFVNS